MNENYSINPLTNPKQNDSIIIFTLFQKVKFENLYILVRLQINELNFKKTNIKFLLIKKKRRKWKLIINIYFNNV